MSNLLSEIEQAEAEVDALAARLASAFARIDAEAHRQRMLVVEELDRERADLHSRLHHLRALARIPEPHPRIGDVEPVVAPRRRTTEIVLRLLADEAEPVSAGDIDAAIIAGGWSKAASDKTKKRLKDLGLIDSDKRHYIITEKGRLEDAKGRRSSP